MTALELPGQLARAYSKGLTEQEVPCETDHSGRYLRVRRLQSARCTRSDACRCVPPQPGAAAGRPRPPRSHAVPATAGTGRVEAGLQRCLGGRVRVAAAARMRWRSFCFARPSAVRGGCFSSWPLQARPSQLPQQRRGDGRRAAMALSAGGPNKLPPPPPPRSPFAFLQPLISTRALRWRGTRLSWWATTWMSSRGSGCLRRSGGLGVTAPWGPAVVGGGAFGGGL